MGGDVGGEGGISTNPWNLYCLPANILLNTPGIALYSHRYSPLVIDIAL